MVFAAALIIALIGCVCISIGLSNRKGNISSLHSYHRSRVSEADRIPFGKQVGLGLIVIGCAIILFGGLLAAAHYTRLEALTLAGTVVMLAGLVVGLVITVRAMKKYNKGIF